MQSGTIYITPAKKSETPFLERYKNHFYRTGHLALGWLAGTISGISVVVGVDTFFRFTGAYDTYPDGRFPSYANAVVNLAIRLPLWLLGTFVLIYVLADLAMPKPVLKRVGLIFLNFFLYLSLIILSLYLTSFVQYAFDLWFAGFFGLIILPGLLTNIFSILNPFKQVMNTPITRREMIWVATGALSLIIPLIYILIVLPIALSMRQ